MSDAGGDEPKVSQRRALIGRTSEISRLTELVRCAHSGQSALVSLVGDPGIGKTLLAREVLEIARAEGARVADGRCHEEATQSAFRPWLQIFRTLLEQPSASSLYEVLGIEESQEAPRDAASLAEGTTPLKNRIELFDAVVRTLVDYSDHAPVVLVLEDVHWADSASLLLLRFAAREIAARGIVLVVTHRPEQIYADRPFTRAMRAWESEPLHVRLDLQGLGPEDAAALVQQEAARLVAREITPDLIAKSGGNPLLLIQMVRHILEATGPIDAPSGRRSAVTAELPTDVRELILQRIKGLAAPTRQALEAAACSGSVFEHAQLQATLRELGTEAGDLLDSLDEASDAGLVEEDSGLASYRFSHALIRESLLSSIPARRKRMIHGAIVAAIETVHAAQIDAHLPELALHSYESATGVGADKATSYAASAAGRAYSSFAFDEAALWFNRAIEIVRLHNPSDQRSQAELTLGVGQSLSMAGRGHEAIEKFTDALEMARALEHWGLFGWCVYGMCIQWSTNSVVRIGESRDEALILEALERADADDFTLRATLMARLGAERATYDPGSAAKTAREGLDLALRQDDARIFGTARSALRIADWRPDNLSQRLDLSRESVDGARQAGEVVDLAAFLPLLIIDLLESGAADEAKNETEHYRVLANKIMNPFFLWQLGVIESMWLMLGGAFAEAESRAQATFNAGFEHNPTDAGAIFGAFNFALAWWRGGLAPHEQPLRDIMSQMPIVPGWRAGLATICAETGKADLAREQIDLLTAAGLESIPRDATYLTTMTLLAETAHRLADPVLAKLMLPLLAASEDQFVVVGNAVACHGSVAGYLAALTGLAGDPAQANRLFAKAITLETGIGSQPLATKTRSNWIEFQARSDCRNADFDDLAARTRADADRFGMTAVLGRLDALTTARKAPAVAPRPDQSSAERGEPAVYRRQGEFRTIAFATQEIQLKESKGLAYLEHLLRHPGREFFSLELVGLLSDAPPDSGQPRAGDAGETLDAQAVTQYRMRIQDLRSELEEAEEMNDRGRADRLREELEFVADQLGGGLGLGGRKRKAASDSERARVNVTRAIRSSVRKIADAHPPLGRRLIKSIRTGNVCSYEADEDRPIAWEF